jgi:hypothetical protein
MNIETINLCIQDKIVDCNSIRNLKNSLPKNTRSNPTCIDVSSLSYSVKNLLHSQNKHQLIEHLDDVFSRPIAEVCKSIDDSLRFACNQLKQLEFNIKYKGTLYHVSNIADKSIGPFKREVMESLVYQTLLSPEYAIEYSAFYHYYDTLKRLISKYPDYATKIVASPSFDFFSESSLKIFEEEFSQNTEKFDDIFTYLVKPNSLSSEQYLFVLNICLYKDEEKTLLILANVDSFSTPLLSVISHRVIQNYSPMDFIASCPFAIRPFVLTLINAGYQ